LEQNVGFDDSGHDADDLGIGGEPAKHLLGAGYTVVDADLKDAPTGPPQCHLRIWSLIAGGWVLAGDRWSAQAVFCITAVAAVVCPERRVAISGT
jgi:hypothetical protein